MSRWDSAKCSRSTIRPSTLSTPLAAFSGRPKAATTVWAQAMASGSGVKAALAAAT